MNRFIIPLCLLILGCNDPPIRDVAIEQLYEDAIARGADPDVVKSFDYLPKLAEAVNNSSSLTVYDGVPRDVGQEREWKSNDAIEIDGFSFFKSPARISKGTNPRLWELIASNETFAPFGGATACGGFHPDWCLIVETENGPINVHLCFGCEEVKAMKHGKELLYCDLRTGKIDEIDKLLHQLR